MNLPIFSEPEIIDKSDSNFNAISKKAAFKKQAKLVNRDDAFEILILQCGGLPKKNEVVFIKTNGTSDTGSIFTHIANQENLHTLYLSTWIISRENIERICKLIDTNRLEKVVFVVSTRLQQLKKSNFAFLKESAEKRKESIFLKVCNSHAKTFSVSTKLGNLYTVTGSGNWTENPRIENYVIFNDENAFEHNRQWMEEIVYGTKKSNRS